MTAARVGELVPTTAILVGDVLERLAELPDESVQLCLTSPPYLALRDYGLPPSVWGGDPTCSHAWGEPMVTVKGGAAQNKGLANSEGYRAARDVDAQTIRHGSFCACGAWRGCLGHEPSVELFVEHLVAVFRAVRRVLRPDGVLLVNLGDSYAGSGKGPTGKSGIGDQSRRQGFTGEGPKRLAGRKLGVIPSADRRPGRGIRGGEGYELHEPAAFPECKPKDLMLVPERFVLAMQADGWYVRSRICWAKTSAMPESADDRPTSAWEHVWLFSKSRYYYWDVEGTRQPDVSGHRSGNGFAGRQGGARGAVRTGGVGTAQEWRPGGGARLRNFWLLGPEPSRYEYHAPCDTFYLGPERKAIISSSGAGTRSARLCPVCLARGEIEAAEDGWVAHFAAFPTELARRAILGGTSEHGACAACGAPWRRVVEKVNDPEHARSLPGYRPGWMATYETAKSVSDTHHARPVSAIFAEALKTRRETVGWRPSCRCQDAGVRPCTVLDVFAGSGTLAVAAKHLGRSSIGIELNPRYARIAHHRVARDVPKWARPVLVTRKRSTAASVQAPLPEAIG